MSTAPWIGPPVPGHGSTDFIKCRSLATGSTAQIKPIESVSRLLISVVHHRSDSWDGWLRLGRRQLALVAECHGRARRLTGVRVFSSYGGWFFMRFAPTGSQRWGNVFMLTLIGIKRLTVDSSRQLWLRFVMSWMQGSKITCSWGLATLSLVADLETRLAEMKADAAKDIATLKVKLAETEVRAAESSTPAD
jgi:hypothetical protein